MNEVENRLSRRLSAEEEEALRDAAKRLERAFKKPVFGVVVTAHRAYPDEAFGVMVSFRRDVLARKG